MIGELNVQSSKGRVAIVHRHIGQSGLQIPETGQRALALKALGQETSSPLRRCVSMSNRKVEYRDATHFR